jgi:putative membrane-bound dehydrogenase-like protein
MRTALSFGFCIAWLALAAAAADDRLGLRVPAGFEVIEVADSALANDIYRMTLDPRGRIVVAGRGYIRTLVDDDGDGRAERAINFADGPRDGAMGLLWEGDTLYVTGDGGLRRYHDRDGDGRADGPSELIRAMKTGGEHNAHAIRRGPDGWLYVICGNFTGIDASYASLATSPIRAPIAGCVLRFTPDLKASEIVADGFRNPYGMDFNPDGELFAFDSDNERCVSLPWYEPTRFYHVISGAHHGWRAPQRGDFWRVPPEDPDVTPPLITLGWGSPTGVVCYRHDRFPARYRGGFFLLDWTFGKVHFVTLERAGASYNARPEVFAEAVGSNGFAPTDVVVHPDTGDLYLSVGGRGTRGAVYRVRYAGDAEALDRGPGATQPALASRSLDWRPELLAAAATGDDPARLRGLIAIRRHRDKLAGEEVRSAIEANWSHPDRAIRRAAVGLIAELDGPAQQSLGERAWAPAARATYALGIAAADPTGALVAALRLVDDAGVAAGTRLDAVRAVQLGLGGLTAASLRGTVWEGYSSRRDLPWPAGLDAGPAHLLETTTLAVLRHAYPSGSAALDRELSRTLAMVRDEAPETLEKVASRLDEAAHPVAEMHDLIVLARLRAPRPAAVTARVAAALLSLDRKLDGRRLHRDRYWPLRMAELHAELARRDPGLNAALLAAVEFGRPGHALFALAPGFDRQRAAEIFLTRARADDAYSWSPDLVELVGGLDPERSFPVLRALWGRAGVDEAILEVLANHPKVDDRSKFLEGLGSPQWATVSRGLDALEALSRTTKNQEDGDLLLALVRALGRIPDGKESAAMKERIARSLRRVAGTSAPGTDRAAWVAWLAQARPDLAQRLGGADGVDLPRWQERLSRIDWPAGAAGRGREVFVKTGCAACHSGGRALGPDLRGAGGRFARDDLFTAILQPSRDVSARYQTTLVATADGQVYQGMIVYEAVDGVILQTGATSTIRLAGDQIAARRDAPGSLMPAGLLDKLSDREIADLYAFLKSLGEAVEAIQP